VHRRIGEIPHVREAVAVAVAELVEDDAAGVGDTLRDLQQLDQLLRGQAAGERLGRELHVVARPDQEGTVKLAFLSGTVTPQGPSRRVG